MSSGVINQIVTATHHRYAVDLHPCHIQIIHCSSHNSEIPAAVHPQRENHILHLLRIGEHQQPPAAVSHPVMLKEIHLQYKPGQIHENHVNTIKIPKHQSGYLEALMADIEKNHCHYKKQQVNSQNPQGFFIISSDTQAGI